MASDDSQLSGDGPRLVIDVLTIFPGMFAGVLDSSILRIAQEKQLVSIRLHDLRDYSTDRHRSVDDRPYGGGPGMVMKPEPIFDAVEDIIGDDAGVPRLLLTPQGERLRQAPTPPRPGRVGDRRTRRRTRTRRNPKQRRITHRSHR